MIKIVFVITSFIASVIGYGQNYPDAHQRDIVFYNSTTKWFAAWNLVSKDIYKLNKVKPVEFVFFDDQYVYSTSAITIQNGVPVKGSKLQNLSFVWKKALHHDSLTLPDKSVVPVQLMSFAAAIPNAADKSFFVMPLPAYWAKAGITSKELGLENLITGVFIHEFSHSQQMQNFGKKITEYEKEYDFGIPFSDDLVQDLFDKDSSYQALFNEEVRCFYAASKGSTMRWELLNAGLQTMKQRQQTYFKKKYKNLDQIDNFFLTMEGLGQYSMYVWLIHPKGGNIKKQIAIEGVRRKKNRWSQDEGFALFLILDKLSATKNWIKKLFGSKTESVITFINQLQKVQKNATGKKPL